VTERERERSRDKEREMQDRDKPESVSDKERIWQSMRMISAFIKRTSGERNSKAIPMKRTIVRQPVKIC
jgi:hypothetical protein